MVTTAVKRDHRAAVAVLVAGTGQRLSIFVTRLDDTSRERITVVIADDHVLARQGLARAIGLHPDLQLVAEAEDGSSAMAAIEQFQPNIALIDVRMPGVDGIELCAHLRGREPQLRTRVVLLTALPTPDLCNRALAAGAVAFLGKEIPRQDLCDALVAAARP